MKIAIKICLLSILSIIFSFNTFGQTCSDGGYQWSDIATIFETYTCSSAGCHGANMSSGLDLINYSGFSAGGTKCGTEIFNGTTLVDIIETGATCGTADGGAGGMVGAMNNLIGVAGPVSAADIAAIQAYIDGGAFENCRGVPEDDGYTQCGSSINEMGDIGQTTACSDGSDLPVISPPSSTALPDVQIAVEVNGMLVNVSDDGSFDASMLAVGDELCYTAFAFNLADINALLETANSLCPGLDFLFPDLLPCAPIAELIAGTNPGSLQPGLEDLQEVLNFASSLSTPITSVQSAVATLNSLNGTIVPINLGPICYATSSNICITVEECVSFVDLPTDDGYTQCGSSVNEIGDIGVTGACSDGSNLPSITAPTSSALPDVQIATEVNGELAGISVDGIIDDIATLGLTAGDEICYNAFAFNLADINALLETANSLCPGLDFLFPDLLPCAPIAELIAGTNTGSQQPGLEDLQEVLNFASSLSTPINSVQSAISTLNTLNETIVPINLGPICYAVSTSECIVLSDDDCGPCAGSEVEVTFSVDMSCSGTEMRPPVVTGPFNGFSGDGNVMIDPDGDDIWEAVICAEPGTQFEYKYAIENFVEQENLVDDAIGGANGNTCNLNTNFFDFSNRLITIPAGGGALPTDGYGICGSCDDPPVNVTFSVDMNCSDVTPGTTVAMFGGFNGFCCPYNLTDADGDNVWTTTLPFPTDDTGCISMQYLYMSPDFSNVESFLDNGEDIANCGSFFSDYYSFANRIVEVCTDVVLDEYWNTCTAPAEPAGGCDDGDCANGVETWDGCACVEGQQAVIPDCDDMDCSTVDDYDEATCSCTNTPDPNLPLDCDDGDCSTIDAYDAATCSCSNTPDTNLPLDCDDSDCSTIDAYDAATCSCSNTPDPNLPLDCDDGDCNTEDSYDTATCSCVNTIITVDPDDGCEFTDDSYDSATCTVSNISNCAEGTTLDLAMCACTTIVVDGCTDLCDPNYDAASTNDDLCAGYDTVCDDSDCSTIDAYDAENCTCTNTLDPNLPLDCDDGDCNTEDSYDTATCSCVNTTITVDPDDGCEFTDDVYDSATCTVTNTPNCPAGTSFDAGNCACTTDQVDGCLDPCDPNYNSYSTNDELCAGYSTDCDDSDCSTIDAYDTATCSCTNTPDPNLPLACDDGDCANGQETYNAATCACEPGTPPTCADGEQFNTTTCMCEPIPATCDDPCAPNFGEVGACADYSTDCDDGDCNTEDSYDATSCSCVNTIITVDPDDGCEFTDDTYDSTTCTVANVSNCADGTTLDLTNCECTTDLMCEDPCAPNFGDAEACEAYDMTCPDDTCIEFYSWNAESCICDVVVVDLPNCDDYDECTTDEYDFTLCECAYTPIPDCGACVPPTPGTIDCE